MTFLKVQLGCGVAAVALLVTSCASVQVKKAEPVYQIYAGSTHAHTAYTSSHGANLQHLPNEKKFLFIDSNSVGHAINSVPVKDPEKAQGPPSAHFALAKSLGYDWYVTTDHSQEPSFYPTSPNAPDWIASHNQAKAATDKNFVAISGYEHSENNGPGATGHLNVINSRSYLNALAPGMDIKYLYKWLDTVSSYDGNPVVATFNHPSAKGYDNWAYRDPKVTDIITMLELINSNKNIHYDGFVNALDAGWKVSPVCGNDNHGLEGIKNSKSRTFVLATAKTKAAILDAMKNRRTYAALEGNIQCRYTVNGEIMGSTLKSPTSFKFDIQVSDPDVSDPKDKITRIDIVKDNGTVVETYNVPIPAHSVKWSPTITDAANKYFFVRVWSDGGADAGKVDATKPIAWLAPVWTGR
ncbi:MAG: hypothetical protein K0S09_682 [Sphingobacteriaceae bacterium]|jgi:hypothetical protein|nr:hypothetical protein [Sphingobacteriaceae bacterium]